MIIKAPPGKNTPGDSVWLTVCVTPKGTPGQYVLLTIVDPPVYQYAGEWSRRHRTSIDVSRQGHKEEEECGRFISMDCMIKSERKKKILTEEIHIINIIEAVRKKDCREEKLGLIESSGS